MARNVFPERTRRRIGLLSVVVALALPACGAASAGTRPQGSNDPAKSASGGAGTMGCVNAAASTRRAVGAPSVPGSGSAIRKVATPLEAPAVASVPVSGPGEPVAAGASTKTAFGGTRALGAAPAGIATPCG